MDSSVLSDDSDYDIVSPDNSIADLRAAVPEPPPSEAARETFNTARLSAQEIQSFVGLSVSVSQAKTTKRIYVDGIFDPFSVRHALQLRQAKLSFPSVWLVVGVFSNDACDRLGNPSVLPEVERCEILRHCRWVDEVVAGAPCTLDPEFLVRHKIDYVAIEAGATVDPSYDKLRLKGYDELKKNAMVILTRRTTGVVSAPPRTPVPSEPETLAEDSPAHIDIYGLGY
ncbi:cholinephosphate cytidylyltransferase [Mycena albidolilacea]|uniref:choline-phosphate cytidylyltransferase n=1 Tax=Mycena albidolilacea TaxID=1033008 RepID=A0AAD6ZQ06_9AGAR|nr:cholinephosphate cytidylyltransferase [Mycena albidolilacea]